MTYSYYVAVDDQGSAGLAATKQSVVAEAAAQSGAEIIEVSAPNAYIARREALAAWNRRRRDGVC